MEIDKELKQRLIDAIALGNIKKTKEAMMEIKGEIIRIQTFMDLMKWSTSIGNPGDTRIFIWDPVPELRELVECVE